MTPFGEKMRKLRADRAITLKNVIAIAFQRLPLGLGTWIGSGPFGT